MTLNVGIVGSGAWGTALGIVVAAAGHRVRLVSRRQSQVEDINEFHKNGDCFPDALLSSYISATQDLGDMSTQDLVILALPAQNTRGLMVSLAPVLNPKTPLVITSKGVEATTLSLMSQVVRDFVPNPLMVLAGPNFAIEAAQGLPAAATIAVETSALADLALLAFGSSVFRPYLSKDLIGVQLGGVVKNVLAIASGLVQGKGLGENARAALISRGLAEMVRLGLAMGGQQETFLGLAGCGDLILTCTSGKSRNMSYGMALAQHQEEPTFLCEGIYSAEAVVGLAQRYGVEMPICASVARLISKQSTLDEEIKALMGRPLASRETVQTLCEAQSEA